MSQIDYQTLLPATKDLPMESKVKVLVEQLPDLWKTAYLTMTTRETSIFFVRHGSFQYMFDHPMFKDCERIPYAPSLESRLVAAFGRSDPQQGGRDDFRLKGWLGPTEKLVGRSYDKGHFIAHSIGGAVDKCELNVFLQNRRLNRGWSAEGKRFRLMERYCAGNAGVFCFSRPIYADGSAKPSRLEFGVLKTDGELWVEIFDDA